MNNTYIKQELNYSLLFDSKEEQDHFFKSIKNTKIHQKLINEIRAECEKLLSEKNQELSYSLFKLFSENGSRIEYEKAYFYKRRRLVTFALMVLLEPDEKVYLDALSDMIWSICDEYSWCLPAHLKNSPETASAFSEGNEEVTVDLFASETAFALSEIYQLTKDKLDPFIIKRIYQEIDKRVFKPFLNQAFWWNQATNNWSSVCAGSIGAAALHLMEDHHQLNKVIDKVLPSMEYYLSGFLSDGTCLEGYGYWQYGFGFFVYFADLLKKKTNGKQDLFDDEKVHQIALFQQKSFIHKNLVVNFSDAPPKGYIFLGLSHYLTSIYSDVQVPEEELSAKYTDDHCSRWAPAIRNLLWINDDYQGKPWEEATYHLKDSNWFISRFLFAKKSYGFATKGGHNAEPHNHNDIGHFILQANGEVFIKDLGSGLYTKDYFSDKRYNYLCNSSEGHSVPIINQTSQSAGLFQEAKIIHESSDAHSHIIHMDLSRAYRINSLKTLRRSFLWTISNKPTLILEDYYSFSEQPESIIERFILPKFKIEEIDQGLIIRGKQDMFIYFNREQLAVKENILSYINHFEVKEEFIALDFIVKKPNNEVSVKIEFHF